MNKWIASGLLLLSCSFSVSGDQLTPYTATYSSTIKGINAKLTRTLTKNKQGQWHISNKAEALFLSFTEQSTLQINGNVVQPLNYQYRGDQIEFQWDKNTAAVVHDNEKLNIELHPGVQDKISYQLQIRLDLMAENGQFTDKHYSMISGTRIKTYDIKKVGEETLATPIGNIDTVKIEISRKGKSRKIYAWMAKDKNYLLVRLQRIAEGKVSYSMDLESFDN
jgi:hypothetical protein